MLKIFLLNERNNCEFVYFSDEGIINYTVSILSAIEFSCIGILIIWAVYLHIIFYRKS